MICCFLQLSMNSLKAQSENSDFLNIGLVMPQDGDISNISYSHITKLETKILSILTNNGISSQGAYNGVVAYPKLDIYDEQDVNTGMQNLKTVRLTLSLFIKQADDNVIFSSESKQFSGSGRTREQALNSVINTINPKDTKWATFTKNAKIKVEQYYQKMCSSVIAQADQLSQTGQLNYAMGLLLNIPKDVSCFTEAKNKSILIYKKLINTQCSQNLQFAKAKIAAGDYSTALSIIGRIDPEASCFSEAVTTMNNAATKVDEETRRKWDFLKEAYKNEVELEKLRINAMKDIGVAYWQGQQKTYNYLNIIK
jgi:hypothetical protein